MALSFNHRSSLTTRERSLGRIIAAIILSCLCFGRHAAASLYFQDGINYSSGTILGNDAPWTSPQAAIAVTNGNLTYSNLVPVSPGTNMILVASNSTSVYSYAPLNVPATNGSVYLSFLIKYNSFGGSFTRSGLLQTGNTPASLVTTNDPIDFVDDVYSTGFKLGVRARDGASFYVTNAYSPLQIGMTYLVVLKYSFTNGSASMWLNPPVGGAEPAAADAASVAVGGVVTNLAYVYFRAGSAASDYLVDNILVGSAWQDVTPSSAPQPGLLAFTAQPSTAIAGNTLSAIAVQLQNRAGTNVASNNVPVTLTLSSSVFAGGASTVNSSGGVATFSNLVITAAGTYTLAASAPGFNSNVSTAFVIEPAAISYYSVSPPYSVSVGTTFLVNGTAKDFYGNVVTTNSSTTVTLGSSGNVLFDGNQNGIFGEAGDNTVVLNAGAFSINAQDSVSQTVNITATDANSDAGTSAALEVSTNVITPQGFMLLSFLDSLRVDQYWLVGTSVNFLTGAAGGTGPNMTIGTDSHCSAFAASAANLLGIYMLRPPQASDVNLANNQADWFATNTDGWFLIPSALNAQHMVNTGLLAIASYKASSGSGHIVILRPTTRTDSDINTYGPEECQSGDTNYYDTNVVNGFGEHPGAFPNNINYYGHALAYPISPVLSVLNQGVITNQAFNSTITSLAGRRYQVQWSSNLASWSPLLNFTNPNTPPGFFTNAPFTDSAITNSSKYYRVLAQ